jgi:hypothetical protein
MRGGIWSLQSGLRDKSSNLVTLVTCRHEQFRQWRLVLLTAQAAPDPQQYFEEPERAQRSRRAWTSLLATNPHE